MRVMYSTIGQVRDGQVEGAVGLAVDAAAVMRRFGAEVRFFLVMAGGEQVNSTVFSIEFESPEAAGAAFDAMNGDADVLAVTARTNSADSPSVITSQNMAIEIPVRTPRAGQGGILEVHTNAVHPGRIEDVLAQSVEVCDFVEANGAVNARILQLTYAGAASGLVVLTWELADMAAHAALGSAWFADDGIALQTKVNRADAPSTTVSSALYTSIPI